MTSVEVKEVNDGSGDVYIEFPEKILDNLGWKEGDELKFIDNKDGSFTVKKVLMETIELEFDDDELFKYMQHAHELNMSFNEWVEHVMLQYLKLEKEEKQ